MATAAAKPMTKTQLVATIAEEMGSDKKSASAALDAIVAIVTGHLARRDMRAQPGRHDGDGLALAGLILGWTQMVLLGLFVLGLLFVALLVAVKGWG